MNGAEIERLIQLLGRLPGLGPRSARRVALHLLKNPELREAVVVESQKRARERLSFEWVRSQLVKFFAQLAQRP